MISRPPSPRPVWSRPDDEPPAPVIYVDTEGQALWQADEPREADDLTAARGILVSTSLSLKLWALIAVLIEHSAT